MIRKKAAPVRDEQAHDPDITVRVMLRFLDFLGRDLTDLARKGDIDGVVDCLPAIARAAGMLRKAAAGRGKGAAV